MEEVEGSLGFIRGDVREVFLDPCPSKGLDFGIETSELGVLVWV